MDPCAASVVDLAEFFLFLRDVKLLSVPAIRGYRSALGPVLRLRGLDLTADPHLSMLFPSFVVSAPPRSPRCVRLGSLFGPSFLVEGTL